MEILLHLYICLNGVSGTTIPRFLYIVFLKITSQTSERDMEVFWKGKEKIFSWNRNIKACESIYIHTSPCLPHLPDSLDVGD